MLLIKNIYICGHESFNICYMKNTLLLLLFCFCSLQVLADGQTISPNLKFGKPTMEELTMETYSPDSSATAVILCDLTDVNYIFRVDRFKIIYSHKVKIKILKPEGTSYANVTIPYYEHKTDRSVKELVTGLEATAYNVEGGKIVRTKMKRDVVFRERINDYYMQVKFSIPQVKAGTVLEYEYMLESDIYSSIHNWQAQSEIPTLYTEYDIVVPEYFRFNIDMRGSETLKRLDEPTNLTFSIGGDLVPCSARHLNFKGNQLPALKDDSYVWYLDDYNTQVNLELQGVQFPGALYKTFTQTWGQIDKLLLEDTEFGGRLKMNNPLKEEMAALPWDKMNSTMDKIAAIYILLKNKVKWNGNYALYGNSSRQILKEGTGSNADINFILISMLKDAGIPAYPAVMSRRNLGMLPYAHPSLQKLNTFIVAIANTDSTMVYLDGSVGDGYINIIPPVLMADRARIIAPNGQSQWVGLANLGRNQLRSSVRASISPEGVVTGTRETVYMGQYASNLRNKYRTAKDSTEFVNKLASDENIQVKAISMKGRQLFSPEVRETVEFEKQSTVNDEFIYVNPLVFLHVSESTFKQAERKLPVEFPYLDQVTLSVNLTIPEGYTVDEIPESIKIGTNNGKVSCRYVVSQQNNLVSIRYTFQLNQLLFLHTDYPELQKFWEVMANKNNEMMVLKKQ